MAFEMESRNHPIGILALQGDFAAHGLSIAAVGRPWIEIRYPEQIRDISGLIIPGGESTTVTKLLSQNSFSNEVISAAQRGMPIYGSCAGAILLAEEVKGNGHGTLGLMDIQIERNAYGRQVDSFIAHAPCPALGPPDLEMVFIRAPVVRKLGTGVEVLASWKDHPVFLRQGNIVVTTFHPELSDDLRIHGLFANMTLKAEGAVAS